MQQVNNPAPSNQQVRQPIALNISHFHIMGIGRRLRQRSRFSYEIIEMVGGGVVYKRKLVALYERVLISVKLTSNNSLQCYEYNASNKIQAAKLPRSRINQAYHASTTFLRSLARKHRSRNQAVSPSSLIKQTRTTPSI
jgi:hypothetical protein